FDVCSSDLSRFKKVTDFETRLENLEKVNKPREEAPIQMDLPNVESSKNQVILRVEGISGMVGEHILWNTTDLYMRGGDKLAVIGANGSGTTMLINKLIKRVYTIKIYHKI